MKKKNYQQLFSVLLLVLTFGVVLYVGFSGNDIRDLADALRTLTPGWIAACVGCWVLYVLCETLSMHHFLHMQGHPIRFRSSLHAAMTGIYYSNITPGATGGQPMVMYRLSKNAVPLGVSASCMAVKFVVFQSVLLIVGTVLWIVKAPFVNTVASGSFWFILLGYAANFFSIAIILLMAISRKTVLWIIDKCIAIGVKLRFCKNPEASRKKWQDHCSTFYESVQLVIRRPKDLFIQCAISFGQLMSLMLVILAVYYALGLSGNSPVELITVGVLLYIGASYVPLPGASGAQEGGFAVLFGFAFPDAKLFVALLIWRFCTYYLSIIAGVVMTIGENVHGMRLRKKSEA